MKTLEMLIKAETNGKTYVVEGLYYSKEKGFVDKDNKPWEDTFSTLNDLIHDDGNWSDGWVEIIQVSDDEKVILRNLNGKWLARDESNSIYVYQQKPWKEKESWDANGDYNHIDPLSHLFQMVKWEDDEPMLIADLLGENNIE